MAYNFGHDHIFSEVRNAPDFYGRKPSCVNCKCALQVCIQSCKKDLCINCWKLECEEKHWDYCLSRCANKKCDYLKISTRWMIDQHNVHELLGLPCDQKSAHISLTRRQIRRDDVNENSNSESEGEDDTQETLSDIEFINDEEIEVKNSWDSSSDSELEDNQQNLSDIEFIDDQDYDSF